MYFKFQNIFFLCAWLALVLVQCTDNQVSHQKTDTPAIEIFQSVDIENIIRQAEKILAENLVSVNNKKNLEMKFQPGTYASFACYWWPNPDTPDGLPYIRNDGHVNPETRGDLSDLPAMIEMSKRIQILALAYKNTRNEIYAERAISQLNSWFSEPDTAMLPHLEHAQIIRGRDTGRSYGVIDTWWLVRVIYSIPLLEHSQAWNNEIETALKNWFTSYLNWLRNSNFGKKEMRSKNNHGTWYDVQVVTFANFVGQADYAQFHLETITRKRLNRQLTRSGRQRHETRRPRPEHYSIYNLSGWFELLDQAKMLNTEIVHNRSPFSGTVEDGVYYLINLMQTTDFETILDPADRTDSDRLYLDLLFKAAIHFENPVFYEEISRVKSQVRDPGIVYLRHGDTRRTPAIYLLD